MKKVIVVYKTDNWHSYASRDIIGIATNKEEAINICQLQSKREGETITADDMFNLSNISQTQGYKGEGEFHFEELETNKLV